ncbi:hypothetical protein B0T24DRAFT_692887 [Lasiosphaeria ovina]|uniref:Uncharacterized protein n=1 Tax=Lasiosphaeria ovina TaxID=92902 RepID=A0AAE0JS94_9PEZI|nr:hypothetical protein B0T24DRAFT_692887 [Lasiosphaeria ovina]
MAPTAGPSSSVANKKKAGRKKMEKDPAKEAPIRWTDAQEKLLLDEHPQVGQFRYKTLPHLYLMEAVFQDDRGATGNLAPTIGQLLTADSQLPIDPALLVISDDEGEGDDLPVPAHMRTGQKRSATCSGDPKRKKRRTQGDMLFESIRNLTESFSQEPAAGEWLEKAMEIFNADWYTVLTPGVAEKAQQQWEDSEMKAKRFYLLKKEAREACLLRAFGSCS